MARAPRLHRGGRWFESITAHPTRPVLESDNDPLMAARVSDALDGVLRAVGLFEPLNATVNAALYRVVRSLSEIDPSMALWPRRGEIYYRMGKHLHRKGNFAEALQAFRASEVGLVDSFGPVHPYVVAAVVQQGYCAARLDDRDAACREYARALGIMHVIGEANHPLAESISKYMTAASCGQADAPD